MKCPLMSMIEWHWYLSERQDKGVTYNGWNSHRARSSKPLVASVAHVLATKYVKRTQLGSRR